MSYKHFYKKLEALTTRMFPGVRELPSVAWDHLVSPLEVQLPKSVLKNATAAVEALHAVSRRPAYIQKLPPVPGVSDVLTGHESALMAYDFHTNEAGECFLVEINTNASGYLIASLMTMAHKDVTDWREFEPLVDLGRAFSEELATSNASVPTPFVAITDEDIPNQKMYIEFLIYRDWFRQFGWKAEFFEPAEMTWRDGILYRGEQKIDLVYNRLTDFYLEQPESSALAQAFCAQSICLTPNPREYWLLADKERLIQLTQPGFLDSVGATAEESDAIRRVLIPTFEIKDFPSHDEIWHDRKNLFFKPKRSHGGKSVYRGESVSRKVFERLMSEDILIQRFTPAQKMPTDDSRSVLNNWKFDLRLFVYRNRVQMCTARIYQGQVTNFSSPLGGFTLVRF
jgi:hypothetical protein